MEKKKYIAPDIEVIEMEKSYFLTGSFKNQNAVAGQAAYENWKKNEENWENLPNDRNIMTGDQKLEIDNKGSGGGDYNLWGDM